MVITRHDLARAAEQLGLGLRIGERRYILSALMAQAPDAMLTWLADEAGRSAARLAGLRPVLDPVAGFWETRARAMETCLRQIGEAPEKTPCRPTSRQAGLTDLVGVEGRHRIAYPGGRWPKGTG